MFSIRAAKQADIIKLMNLDFSFLIDSTVSEPFDGLGIGMVSPLSEPYYKEYGTDAEELAGYLSENDQGLFVVEEFLHQPLGYVAFSHGWNHYAVIDDIAIDSRQRGKGMASLLMDAVVDWAKARNLAGIRLETQNNNVAACQFYQNYGFILGGFDRLIYKPMQQRIPETALFWYLPFQD